jgi:hypothetical protein
MSPSVNIQFFMKIEGMKRKKRKQNQERRYCNVRTGTIALTTSSSWIYNYKCVA